jgi:leader peptidase (prepilin peptidase)/N-methyltransferase
VDSVVLWIGFAFAYGLVIGSFLNVVIFRLPEGLSVVSPGSRCPGCESPIRAWDNLPVLSYLVLRGQCRRCGSSISMRYPAVELATAVVFAAIAWRFGPGWFTPLYALFAAGLIAAALIDFDHQIIPDEISVGGLVAGLLLVPVAAVASDGVRYVDALLQSAAGALLGGGLLWTVAFLHARLSVALGREFAHWPGQGEELPRPSSADYWLWFPGMGLGDVKLLAMIGAFLGPWGVLETIIAASLLGLALGLGYAAVTRKLDAPFGFGPAIAAGALLALLVPISSWLLQANPT